MQTVTITEITEKVTICHDKHDIVNDHVQIHLFPTSSLAVDCFEDMSPFAASNFDSPLAAQTEAGNDSEWHFRMNSCSVQLQLGNVSTADRACKSFCKSNEFSQLRRCLSCKVQMDQPSTSRAERGTNAKTEAQLLCLTLSWYPKIGYLGL
jgi:hypothetical protein